MSVEGGAARVYKIIPSQEGPDMVRVYLNVPIWHPYKKDRGVTGMTDSLHTSIHMQCKFAPGWEDFGDLSKVAAELDENNQLEVAVPEWLVRVLHITKAPPSVVEKEQVRKAILKQLNGLRFEEREGGVFVPY